LAFEVRSAPLTSSFRVVTELGGAMVTTVVAMVTAAVVWRRCQALALLVLITVLGRSVLSFGLKAVVDRPRPDLEPLATVSSASFPSGHVLAAVALWGLLPPVVGVLTSNRRVWWASVALSAIIVASVSASRIYLGVHWLTDVVGSLLVGLLLLWVIEVVLERLHRSDGCHRLLHDPGGRTSPAAS
jgi:undecaprenyl-diphosphatase